MKRLAVNIECTISIIEHFIQSSCSHLKIKHRDFQNINPRNRQAKLITGNHFLVR